LTIGFRYKVKKVHQNKLDKGVYPQPTMEKEILTGLVQGKDATDIEEYLARALEKQGIAYKFQTSYIAQMSLPGEVRLDFLVHYEGLYYPIQVDGEYAHKSAAQKERDRQRDAILNRRLAGLTQPVVRVPSDAQRYDLTEQKSADDFVREFFIV